MYSELSEHERETIDFVAEDSKSWKQGQNFHSVRSHDYYSGKKDIQRILDKVKFELLNVDTKVIKFHSELVEAFVPLGLEDELDVYDPHIVTAAFNMLTKGQQAVIKTFLTNKDFDGPTLKSASNAFLRYLIGPLAPDELDMDGDWKAIGLTERQWARLDLLNAATSRVIRKDGSVWEARSSLRSQSNQSAVSASNFEARRNYLKAMRNMTPQARSVINLYLQISGDAVLSLEQDSFELLVQHQEA